MSILNYKTEGTIGANLLPHRYDINIYRGDTFDVTIHMKDSAGSAIDLSGFTGLIQFRNESDAVVATPTATMNAGGVIGACELLLLDTSALNEGSYTWDLQLTDSAGRRRTYIGGAVMVTGDISKDV